MKPRATKDINAWLARKGISKSAVAGRAGVDNSLVTRTIKGQANNRKVLSALVGLGCPARYLRLPADMTEAA